MQAGKIITLAVFAIFCALLLTQLPGGPDPPPHADGTVGTQTSEAARLEAGPDDTATATPARAAPTVEATTTQAGSPAERPASLTRQCAPCHQLKWLEQIEKTRPEWEETLALMAAFGASLDEQETARLIDYLTSTEQPY